MILIDVKVDMKITRLPTSWKSYYMFEFLCNQYDTHRWEEIVSFNAMVTHVLLDRVEVWGSTMTS